MMPYVNPNQDPEFRRLMRRLQNARTKTVVHHETCPCCGAKLVNLYRRSLKDSAWKCRKCWDTYDKAASEFVTDSTLRCSTCQVFADAVSSAEHTVCAWYVENVLCGDKSIKSCPNYKAVEVTSNG